MKFTKMEGAGNDYVYVDARRQEQDWPELSRRMSDRHFGVGSDGLILIADSNVADLKMVMFNADGSQGEMCGNGIRCFAKYAIERDIAALSARRADRRDAGRHSHGDSHLRRLAHHRRPGGHGGAHPDARRSPGVSPVRSS